MGSAAREPTAPPLAGYTSQGGAQYPWVLGFHSPQCAGGPPPEGSPAASLPESMRGIKHS